ncbi:MAG: M24 family metallopeptidase [Opitutaceae bacterium]
MPSAAPPLLYADTDRSADMLYFGRVGVPDPFIAFSARGRKVAVVSALEFGRIRRASDFDLVLPLERWIKRAQREHPRRQPGPADIIALLARHYGLRRFAVPRDFPAGVYRRLRRLGVRAEPVDGPFFPQREIKTRAEAEAIRQGNRCSAAGIAAAESVLRASRIRGGRLVHRGRALTSEMLKAAIETACLAAGGVSLNTIAAGGEQACDPHESGTGLLHPGELIVVDVFPRITASGYYGDMTRTFLRGRASEAQRALVEVVREGQKIGLAGMRGGADGRSIHRSISDHFQARGYRTRATARGAAGFFHGTGHGVGLNIHEPPRVNSTNDYRLKPGAVITVEPGLYYPGLGGCRVEDVVQVTPGAPRLLSRYPYEWELR